MIDYAGFAALAKETAGRCVLLARHGRRPRIAEEDPTYGENLGLTDAGRQLARVYLDQGIVMDVSHLSDAGADELFGLTDAPIIASHSNARSICNVPRNLADWQIEEIVRRHGLIGLNLFGPFVAAEHPTIDDLLRHADHILSLGGEDVLALGCDLDGCQGVFPEGFHGVHSMPLVRSAFARHLGEAIAEKIFSTNAETLVDRVL